MVRAPLPHQISCRFFGKKLGLAKKSAKKLLTVLRFRRCVRLSVVLCVQGSRVKSAADRTKVVVRHLPPTISEAMLLEQIDDKFTRRFKFVSFRPGNNRLEISQCCFCGCLFRFNCLVVCLFSCSSLRVDFF